MKDVARLEKSADIFSSEKSICSNIKVDSGTFIGKPI